MSQRGKTLRQSSGLEFSNCWSSRFCAEYGEVMNPATWAEILVICDAPPVCTPPAPFDPDRGLQLYEAMCRRQIQALRALDNALSALEPRLSDMCVKRSGLGVAHSEYLRAVEKLDACAVVKDAVEGVIEDVQWADSAVEALRGADVFGGEFRRALEVLEGKIALVLELEDGGSVPTSAVEEVKRKVKEITPIAAQRAMRGVLRCIRTLQETGDRGGNIFLERKQILKDVPRLVSFLERTDAKRVKRVRAAYSAAIEIAVGAVMERYVRAGFEEISSRKRGSIPKYAHVMPTRSSTRQLVPAVSSIFAMAAEALGQENREESSCDDDGECEGIEESISAIGLRVASLSAASQSAITWVELDVLTARTGLTLEERFRSVAAFLLATTERERMYFCETFGEAESQDIDARVDENCELALKLLEHGVMACEDSVSLLIALLIGRRLRTVMSNRAVVDLGMFFVRAEFFLQSRMTSLFDLRISAFRSVNASSSTKLNTPVPWVITAVRFIVVHVLVLRCSDDSGEADDLIALVDARLRTLARVLISLIQKHACLACSGIEVSQNIVVMVNCDAVLFDLESAGLINHFLYDETRALYQSQAASLSELLIYEHMGELISVRDQAAILTKAEVQSLLSEFQESWESRLDIIISGFFKTISFTSKGRRNGSQQFEVAKRALGTNILSLNQATETVVREHKPDLLSCLVSCTAVSHSLRRMTVF